jgi:hypothetical protein
LRARAGTALFVLCVLCGCYRSHRIGGDASTDGGLDASRDAPIDTGIDAPVDAGFDGPLPDVPCDAGPPPVDPEPLLVDLLFVIDDSGSMAEEQAALAAQFPVMVEVLVTGDLDRDGRPDVQPVSDLQVAVVTTNLGSAGFELGGCQIRPNNGSDGVHRTRAGGAGCPGMVPSFLRFRPELMRPDMFVSEFGCVARVGTSGCGLEQPLEAALKAVLPAGVLSFLEGDAHRDGANAGFIRDDAVLAVVLVSDEDDCSVADPELFNPLSETYPWDADPRGNQRCILFPEALTPVGRFVDGMRRAKSDPNDLLVAAITGVPPDLVRDPTDIDYDALLADERMQIRPNPRRPGFLLPACDRVGVGFAVPAIRTVEAVRAFGPSGVVQSICDENFANALTGITTRLGELIRRRRCP